VTIPRGVRVFLIVAALFLAAVILAGSILIVQIERNARGYAITALKEQYGSEVSLGDLQLSLFPRVRATGTNLVMNAGGRRDLPPGLPPLLSVKQFTVRAGLVGLLRYPRHVGRVDLTGLQIHIPPRQDRPQGTAGKKAKIALVVDQVTANAAVLEILPKEAGKDPLTFELKSLTLDSAGKNNPMTFHAELMNAKPPGLIRTNGRFGPWASDDPGNTPVSGQYTFRDADLGVFKGIAGTLASDGRFQGQLQRIEVQGTTDVPNFALTLVRHPMHLRTSFSATVDGVNGNTDLHPVKAILGTSEFEVSGSIERGAEQQGHEIDLTTKSVRASLHDFLRLSVKGDKPPITGALNFESKIRIPPRDVPVIEKLGLDGQFKATEVRFTSPDVQGKIAGLSHRAQGDPRDHDPNVTALLAGRFLLKNGTMTLPQLAFDLPGAQIQLAGNYVLTTGTIDFQGTARLDATVSQMTTGIKSTLLKPMDRLFRHDGAGTLLPVTIGGTRGSPSFRLDIGRLIKSH
jgi:hypothetical protein